MRKDELRCRMREIKRQFSPQQLEELSLPIIARLRGRLQGDVIVAYYPLPDEVDIRPLLDELVAEDKTVLLPKVTGNTTMELRRYTGQQDLREGTYHIMEPIGELFTDYSQISVVLVPGMAFDVTGHRLGRGKGYYDRFLSGITHGDRNAVYSEDYTAFLSPCVIFGVCFDFQKVAEIPTDEHDVPVDEVI